MGRMRKAPLEKVILDAAERVFGLKGYQHTTMDALAQEAGISVGTLYNLFRSKDDIHRHVAMRAGETVLERVEPLLGYSDPEEGVLDLIRLRLCNHFTDRLFFEPFNLPEHAGVQPCASGVGDEVKRLHERYMSLVGELVGRCIPAGEREEVARMPLAACLEGLIRAFRAGDAGSMRPDEVAQMARQVRRVLLRGAVGGAAEPGGAMRPSESRSIHINRYDLDRLMELLDVIRDFGTDDCQEHAVALEEELRHARVSNPREVLPDVITMNSRFRVENMRTGEERVLCLVFPRDADLAPENVSIFTPFGNAVLGRRLGDVFVVGEGRDDVAYRATRMLYQPEAAGDYHL